MITKNNYSLAKNASYLSGITMSIAANFPPLLFVTFRKMYGLSYTMLGSLIVINFLTQLIIDLVFTFYSKHFNIPKTIKATPFIVFTGLVLYSVLPMIFPRLAILWIIMGTVIFSLASGLNEVLLSPMIAAIPSDNPEKEMSKLHSMYAWGVIGVVILSTVFINAFGSDNWMYLGLLWSVIPLAAYIMFKKASLPTMDSTDNSTKSSGYAKKGIILCVLCIFMGGAAECTMSQWASGFIEKAIAVPKIWGDTLGVALFAALLGLGRLLYSKYGKNIINVMLFGMAGAFICYIVASLFLNPVVAIAACALTGFFTSMLWPGTLIYLGEKIPGASVSIYALMAAGGDMGASVAPQLVGIVSDKIALAEIAQNLSGVIGISSEQIAMRIGILSAAIFPLAGVMIIVYMKKYFK